MRHNIFNRILFLLAIAAIILLLPATTVADPPLPETHVDMGGFQGTISVGGSPLSGPATISAWIEAENIGETQASDSTYQLVISGDFAGKSVNFKIDDHQAQQTIAWVTGNVLNVDLSINSWPYECAFYGEVTMDGKHIPDGTKISAWIDEAKVHSTTTIDSIYHLVVPGNYTGKAVLFKVGANYADQIYSWERNGSIEANLNVSFGPLVCGFYGPVTLDGQNAPDGTVVSAWVDSEKMGQTTTIDSTFGLNIPGNYIGKTISYKVGGEPAKETTLWVRGSNVQTGLSAITTSPVEIMMELSVVEASPGDEFTLTININPNGHGISGAEINLFSPGTEVVEILFDQVKPGGLLGASPIEGINEKTDMAGGAALRYALGRKGETIPPTQSGILATIGMRIKGGAPADLYAIPNAITLTGENFEELDASPSIISLRVIANLAGDIDGDGSVGLSDLAILASIYGITNDDEQFLAGADFTSNDEIDLGDLATLGGNWGNTRR